MTTESSVKYPGRAEMLELLRQRSTAKGSTEVPATGPQQVADPIPVCFPLLAG
jgi:hypothetical protein